MEVVNRRSVAGMVFQCLLPSRLLSMEVYRLECTDFQRINLKGAIARSRLYQENGSCVRVDSLDFAALNLVRR